MEISLINVVGNGATKKIELEDENEQEIINIVNNIVDEICTSECLQQNFVLSKLSESEDNVSSNIKMDITPENLVPNSESTTVENPDYSCIEETHCKDSTLLTSRQTISHHFVGESKHYGNGNFFKGCKWSPDGLCFLSNTNDKHLQIFNTPPNCMKMDWKSVKVLDAAVALEACVNVHEPETVYDYCWWPLMNSMDPATCCFVSTSRDQPVHLWDAFDGSLRASYIALNSVQEINSAYSVCFSTDGQQMLCGFKKEVCLFYTDRPGSQYEKWPTSKKNQHTNQNSIISCLAFGPDDSLFACGSYDGTVGLYSSANGHLLDISMTHSTGVTHLKFSADGNRLYTGARKSELLRCWDIRNVQQPIYEMKREVSTNQRIYFDLINNEDQEIYVISGSTDGEVTIWNVDVNNTSNAETSLLNSYYSFKAHNDCVNGCSVHPYLPIIVTSSGQRSFPEPLDSDDESDKLFNTQILEENKLKLWHLCYDKYENAIIQS